MGFETNTSMFFQHINNHILILFVYVDDIILTGSNSVYIQTLVGLLNTKFALKELGALHFFLGIQVQQFNSAMHLSHQKFTHQNRS